MGSEDAAWEIGLLIACLVAFVGYHIYLFVRVYSSPMTTAAGHNGAIRKLWCRHVMEQGKDVLVVQTLRNSMMSSSLLATTALTLSSVVAAFFIRTEGISRIEQLGEAGANLLSVVHKLFFMVVLFMVSFICYMQSIRGDNHVGFMLNVPQDAEGNFVGHTYISSLMFKSSLYHTVGTRFFYAAFLAVIFLFGIIPLSVATLVLVCLLFWTDRCPDPRASVGKPVDGSPPASRGDLLNRVVYK